MIGCFGNLKKEKKKEKPIEDRIVGISAGAGGRNISEESIWENVLYQMLLQLI